MFLSGLALVRVLEIRDAQEKVQSSILDRALLEDCPPLK